MPGTKFLRLEGSAYHPHSSYTEFRERVDRDIAVDKGTALGIRDRVRGRA